MAKPTKDVRAGCLQRDHFRCVRCGRPTALQMQHRQRVGAGGSRFAPGYTELVTACAWCNEGFESNLQTEALVFGWKVRAWRTIVPAQVPVFHRPLGLWGRLEADGSVTVLQPRDAFAAMRAVYGSEWDRLADSLPAGVLGLAGRVAA